MELIRDTVDRFRQQFRCEPEFVVTAPGRVNLIGEHTDYNDGFVLPVAIDRKIIVAIGRRTDREAHIHSIDLLKSVCISLDALNYNTHELWSNYPIGVVHILHQVNSFPCGVNLSYSGNIPMGTGLSSSAAIEVACTIALTRLFHFAITPLELIHLARKAEVEFVGVNCGIMDQFVSVLGKKRHALFLDCRSLEHEYIPCPKGIKLVICDTGIKRELAFSSYNQRRTECEQVVKHFATIRPTIKTLRDVTKEEFFAEEKNIEPTIQRRARHVILENERVLKGVSALQREDLREFGKLMIDSHMSLRDLFEVSCKELDTFVDIALKAEGVYGARMTGAGFGGCGICIVDENSVDTLVDRLRDEYPKAANRSLTIYIASVEDGATVIDMNEPSHSEQVAS